MAFSKSSFFTPIIILSSDEPWSIILTFTLAWARAENILPDVPLAAFIPRPTTAMSARSDSISMLSGCVIAQVFNTLASLFGSVIPFVIVALIGNLFNMALNILGCFVHDLRLQCLEFFGKFYEDGGRPFEPLENRTKYIDIQ